MSATTKLKDQARRHEQKEEWQKAIDAYQKVLASPESQGEGELSLYNRIGDLYLRIGKSDEAVQYYEDAAEQYAAAALYNNAIALCNKALRYASSKPSLLHKLGEYCAAQGFVTDARRWYLEFAEMKFNTGDVDEAFAALEEFADTTDDPELREVLAGRFEAHERGDDALRQLGIAYGLRLRNNEHEAAEALRARILALDPDADLTALASEAEKIAAAAKPADAGYGELEIVSTAGAAGIDEDMADDAEASLPLLGEEQEAEVPAADPGSYGMIEPTLEAPAESAEPADVEPLAGIEGTMLSEDDLGDEVEALPGLEADEAEPLPGLDDEAVEPLPGLDDEVEPLPGLDGEVEPLPGLDGEDEDAELPVMDFGFGGLDTATEDEEETAGFDLGGFGFTDTPEEADAEAERPSAPAGPDAAAVRAHVKTLLDEGRRSAAVDELERLHMGLAEAGDLAEANAVLDELLAVEPDSQRALQHRVEYAFRSQDPQQLLRAYLSLAASLERTGSSTKAKAVYQRVLEIDPEHAEAKRAVYGEPKAAPTSQPKTGYVDLAALVQDALPEATTRFVVAEEEPSGDEDKDFADILSQFKAKVSEHMPVDDPGAHYDLGLAYKEMGLVDEAIAEFQTALRGGQEQLHVYEELGQCFMLKGQYNIAVKVLTRAGQLHTADPLDQIGVYYHLARAFEELGQRQEAKEALERVIGLDVTFRDAAKRLERL